MYYSRGNRQNDNHVNNGAIKRSTGVSDMSKLSNQAIVATDRHIMRNIDDKLLREETAVGSTTYYKLKNHLDEQVDKKVDTRMRQKADDIEKSLFSHLHHICESNNLNCPTLRKSF
uniref:Uncharacterized protein n=1 Tax=Nesodiprion zhejiangensis nucleopolyhedrovirus TaxID=3135970 RepID=A0AAN0N7F6_9BACU